MFRCIRNCHFDRNFCRVWISCERRVAVASDVRAISATTASLERSASIFAFFIGSRTNDLGSAE